MAKFVMNQEFANAMAERMVMAGDQDDWYDALFSYALDQLHDPWKALEAADQLFKSNPAPPPEADADLSEEDAKVFPNLP